MTMSRSYFSNWYFNMTAEVNWELFVVAGAVPFGRERRSSPSNDRVQTRRPTEFLDVGQYNGYSNGLDIILENKATKDHLSRVEPPNTFLLVAVLLGHSGRIVDDQSIFIHLSKK